MQIYQHVKMSQNTCTGINLVRNGYCMDTAGKKPEALFHYAKFFFINICSFCNYFVMSSSISEILSQSFHFKQSS